MGIWCNFVKISVAKERILQARCYDVTKQASVEGVYLVFLYWFAYIFPKELSIWLARKRTSVWKTYKYDLTLSATSLKFGSGNSFPCPAFTIHKFQNQKLFDTQVP